MADMTLAFYDISMMGFYKRGTRDHLFGDVGAALSELHAWVAGKDVSLTELSAPTRAKKEILPVYIFGVEPAGADWVLGTWNTIPSEGGKVSSLARDSVVGAAPTVHDNPVAANSIAGFPTYFWFVPEHNVFASLKFTLPITAVRPMLGYMTQFLRTESGYVRTAEDDESVIVGYQDLGSDDDPVKATVNFFAEVRTKPGEVERLRRDRHLIHTVIRDSSLDQNVRRDRTAFQRISQFVRNTKTPANFVQNAKVHIEMKYTPTALELTEMINHELRAHHGSEYDDLGFKLTGSNDIVWINKVNARRQVTVPLDVPPSGVIRLVDLVQIVNARRAEFLGYR